MFLSNFHTHLVAPHSPADQFAQVDVNGHAWVAGYTGSSLDGHSAGGRDILLMKFDGEGVHQWTDQRGGEGDDYAHALQAVRRGATSFSNLFHGGNIRTLYGVHVRHHHLNLVAQPVGCLYKVKIPVKIWYSDVCGGSLIDVLGLNWIESTSTEWDHV